MSKNPKELSPTNCLVPGMYGPPQDCKGKFGREDKSAQMYSAFGGD